MSRRRKHVKAQLEEHCPELGEGHEVARVVELRGGNHCEASVSVTSITSPHTTRTAAADMVYAWEGFLCG